MPLDEATRRMAFLLQRELRRLAEREAERSARGEELRYDSVSRVATLRTTSGEVRGRLYGEVLATYAPYDRILRWAWVGRATTANLTHGDVIVREGQARGTPQLAMSVLGDLDEEDAKKLVSLGAVMAHAEGIYERRSGTEISYVGLFERPRPIDPTAESHISVPPPSVQERPDARPPSQPPPRAYRSLPPIREVFEPRTSRSSRPPPPVSPLPSSASGRPPTAMRAIREPSRTVFLPVATAALSALHTFAKGYLQGLFVITVHVDPPGGGRAEPADDGASPKRRVVVQLAVVDQAGILRAVDPPESLVEATVHMIEADQRDGNGAWRKLSARITPKPDGGATLNVDVT